jgi:hypothetical protein
LLAGADSKKVKPKYWMQNSENWQKIFVVVDGFLYL